jgi:predicted nuclease of restriction endonuclease-like (RecB) superfamily
MLINSNEYIDLVNEIKQQIQSAQYRATLKVNTELVMLYHNIGSEINKHKVWGNKFIDSLSADLRMDFPGVKGYSVRNLKYMSKFAELFSEEEIVQEALAQITWYRPLCYTWRRILRSSALNGSTCKAEGARTLLYTSGRG